MKRQLTYLLALATVLTCLPLESAEAIGGHGGRHGHGHGRGFGRGFGFGIGGVANYGWDIAELYRELLNNVPYFALHPPVYYSYPVPRTYGYSPFAYPPGVMTPDIMAEMPPLEIINPHVPSTQQESPTSEIDRAASVQAQPEPLVIVNPFVTPNHAVAQH